MLVGYARVSTLDQNPSLQIDALRKAGCGKIYVEKASGARQNRSQPAAPDGVAFWIDETIVDPDPAPTTDSPFTLESGHGEGPDLDRFRNRRDCGDHLPANHPWVRHGLPSCRCLCETLGEATIGRALKFMSDRRPLL